IAVTAAELEKGADDNSAILPKRPCVNILAIEAYDLLKIIDFLPTGKLPKPRHARLHAQAPLMVRAILRNLLPYRRARSHQTHLASQYVPKLREFVEIMTTQEPPQRSYPGVVLHFEDVTFHLVLCDKLRQTLLGRNVHRAKLV